MGGVDTRPYAKLESVGTNDQVFRDFARTERRESTNLVRLVARKSEGFDRLAVEELERQDTHIDEVGPVDALEAARQHGLHAEQQVPLAAQSRDDPAP